MLVTVRLVLCPSEKSEVAKIHLRITTSCKHELNHADPLPTGPPNSIELGPTRSTPTPSVNGIKPVGRAWMGGMTVVLEPDSEGSGFESRGCHGVYRT